MPAWLKGRGERWLKIYEWTRHHIRHYRTTFNIKEGSDRAVLRDLAKFCRGRPTDTVWHPDQRKTDVLIGRHEVWEHIMQRTHLEPQELADLLAGEDKDAYNG